MKKIISHALCCVIAASALASCAQTPVKNYSPKITVSSSEAEESARYLTNRLGDALYVHRRGDIASAPAYKYAYSMH